MASVNMSIRIDSELKTRAEQVFSQLRINTLYAALLRAKTEREQGNAGRPAAMLLSDIDDIIERAERDV